MTTSLPKLMKSGIIFHSLLRLGKKELQWHSRFIAGSPNVGLIELGKKELMDQSSFDVCHKESMRYITITVKINIFI